MNELMHQALDQIVSQPGTPVRASHDHADIPTWGAGCVGQEVYTFCFLNYLN